MAGSVNSETEVGSVLAPEVGIANAEKKQQFRDRAILTFLWKQCRGEESASSSDAVTLSGDLGSTYTDKRAKLIQIFQDRHGFIPPLENQPSEQLLALLVQLHQKGSTEFIPLSRVSNFAENRDIRVEPTRIKGTPFLLEEPSQNSRKNRDFLNSPESFLHAVRVLMRGYTLVSMLNVKGEEWCSLGACQRHVATVESYSRANSRVSHKMHNQIMEAEMATRLEWTKLGQANPGVTLTSIIDTVAQRHAIWPLNSEITRVSTPKGGKWGGDWNSQPRYDQGSSGYTVPG